MKNKLLEVLSSLSEKTIKLLTSDVILRRGYEYYFQRKMVSLAWADADTTLLAYVRGTATYKVKIAYEDDFLVVCNCPAWHEDELCKHAACALLTLSNLLHNTPTDQQGNDFLRVLMAGGSSATERDQQVPIVLRILPEDSNRPYTNPSFGVAFYAQGQRLTETDFKPGSSFLRLMQRTFGLYNLERLLLQFLEEDHKLVHLEVATASGFVPVVYDTQPVTTKTFVTATGRERIELSCRIELEDKTVLDQLVRISPKLVCDLVGQRLLVVKEERPWSWAMRLIEQVEGSLGWSGGQATVLPEHQMLINPVEPLFSAISDPFPLASQDMNELVPLVFEELLRSKILRPLKFYEGEHATVPIKTIPDAWINGTVDQEKKAMRLEPAFMIGTMPASIFFHMIMTFIRGIDQWLRPWLRTKARRQMIIKGLFRLVNAQDRQQEKLTILQLIKEIKNSYDGYTGNSGLKEYFESFYKQLSDDRFEQIVVLNGQFHEISISYKRLWSVAGLLAQFFDEAVVDESSRQLCFMISLDQFYDKFYLFSALLAREGIELRFNRKRVETIKLRVSVDASRASESTWFDLAPHIEAEGIQLSEEQRMVLFARDGTIETADCIKILDPQSREMMALLAKIFQQGEDGKVVKQAKQIVQLPRLHILTLLELRKSGAEVKLAPDDERLIHELTNLASIEQMPLPQAFKGELRSYQKTGYSWFAFLYRNRFGACLADDMGLGKTIQVIAFLGGLKEQMIPSRCSISAPHLIVVPPTLVFNWQEELHKFYPDLRVYVYTGKSEEESFVGYDVVIVTYDRVRLDIDYLTALSFHTLILDEAQAVKNIYAARTAAIRQIKSVFTICLTGTPLENHLGEYHSIIDVAIPGLLPDYKNFMQAVQREDHAELIRKTKPFVLRRTKDTILKELPPKVESNMVLTMTEQQQKVYATTVAEVKRLIDEAYEIKTAAQAKVVALTAILRLRQICISPELIDPEKSYDSPKIDRVVSSLDELIQEGSAALVFSQFTKCLDLLEKALHKANILFYRIDGKTPMGQRKKIVEHFQSGRDGVSILLLSLKTGGVGLNLTRANYVFHIDPWWNPSVENQASDRAHRIGQQNTVFIERLIMHGTIEEKIMLLKEKKLKLFNEVVDQAEQKSSGLISKQDFDLLLS